MACNPANQSPIRAVSVRGLVVRPAQNTDPQPRNVLQRRPRGGRIPHTERHQRRIPVTPARMCSPPVLPERRQPQRRSRSRPWGMPERLARGRLGQIAALTLPPRLTRRGRTWSSIPPPSMRSGCAVSAAAGGLDDQCVAELDFGRVAPGQLDGGAVGTVHTVAAQRPG